MWRKSLGFPWFPLCLYEKRKRSWAVKACHSWPAVVSQLSWGGSGCIFRVAWHDGMCNTKCTCSVFRTRAAPKSCPVAWTSTATYTLGPLRVWFWINCWSERVEKPLYCYQISHDPCTQLPNLMQGCSPQLTSWSLVPRWWPYAGLVFAFHSLTPVSRLSPVWYLLSTGCVTLGTVPNSSERSVRIGMDGIPQIWLGSIEAAEGSSSMPASRTFPYELPFWDPLYK